MKIPALILIWLFGFPLLAEAEDPSREPIVVFHATYGDWIVGFPAQTDLSSELFSNEPMGHDSFRHFHFSVLSIGAMAFALAHDLSNAQLAIIGSSLGLMGALVSLALPKWRYVFLSGDGLDGVEFPTLAGRLKLPDRTEIWQGQSIRGTEVRTSHAMRLSEFRRLAKEPDRLEAALRSPSQHVSLGNLHKEGDPAAKHLGGISPIAGPETFIPFLLEENPLQPLAHLYLRRRPDIVVPLVPALYWRSSEGTETATAFGSSDCYRRFLHDPVWRTHRRASLRLIKNHPIPQPEFVPVLLEAQNDPDPVVRSLALEILPNHALYQPLMPTLRWDWGDEAPVRLQAIRYLLDQGDVNSITLMYKAIQMKGSRVDRQILTLLLTRRVSKQPDLRWILAELLAYSEREDPAFLELMRHNGTLDFVDTKSLAFIHSVTAPPGQSIPSCPEGLLAKTRRFLRRRLQDRESMGTPLRL